MSSAAGPGLGLFHGLDEQYVMGIQVKQHRFPMTGTGLLYSGQGSDPQVNLNLLS